MKILKNLSVRTKLLTGFLSISFLLAIIGFYTGFGIIHMQKNAETLYDVNLQNIDFLHQLKENLSDCGIQLSNALLQRNPEKTAEIEKSMSSLESDYQSLMKSYMNRSFSEESKSSFTTFMDLSDQYRATVKESLAYAENEQYDQAINSLTQANTIRDEMFTNIDKLISDNQKLAADADNSNTTYAEKTMQMVTLIIVFGFIFAVAIGLLLSLYITGSLKKGLKFAQALGEGNLTYELTSKSNDEIGKLIKALSSAQHKIKHIIQEVSNQSLGVSASSQELSASLEELTSSFENIDRNTDTIVDNIEEINAITQELNATVMQVDSGVGELASNSTKSNEESIQIKSRASDTKEQGIRSKALADKLYEEKEQKIRKAIEDGKVVNEISVIAKSIADIAEQTNLLAINAAIEAARAGEQGRGFAVVAEQVKILAEQSASYVVNIQNVVNNVQKAVDNLSGNAGDILDFIATQVKGDYDLLIETGNQYEYDAVYVSDLSQSNAAMAEQLNASTEEISNVVQNISGNMQQAAGNSEEILKNIEEALKAMEQASITAQDQATVAEKLNQAIQTFQI